MSYKPFVPATGIEKHFAWLSAIPHGSANEQALSDAIRDKAIAAGLEVYQDKLGNVLVRKPAAPGCEGKPSVLLQAHLDMVCTRVPTSNHNFQTDPLTLVVDEEGWLHADGTSLGADDGYGCAYMLELLLGDYPNIPELECMFTVQEEIGLIGAAEFDTSIIRSRRLISMDSGGEHITTTSTAGGRCVNFRMTVPAVECSGKSFLLDAHGMMGGHSAGEIHRGRANAIKIVNTVLLALKPLGAAIVEAKGGEADNAIPRYASAIVRIPEDKIAEAQAAVEKLAARFTKLHRTTDPNFSLTLSETDADDRPAYDIACAQLAVAMFDGVRYTDPDREGVLALSSNIGTWSVIDGKYKLQCMIRSISPEYREFLTDQIVATGTACGAEYFFDSEYPGMEYNPNSAMRALFGEVMKEVYDRDIVITASHGGMEIGYFYSTIPGVDIVSMGPNSEGCHSPFEKLDLASFNKMFTVLVKMLERVK